MSASNYLEEQILNAVLRGQTFPSISTVYVALMLTDAGEDNTGSEVSGNGYERVSASFTAPSQDGTVSFVENNSQVEFPEATGTWGDIGYFAIYDSSTGGNLLFYGALNQEQTVEASQTLRFNTGEITVRID